MPENESCIALWRSMTTCSRWRNMRIQKQQHASVVRYGWAAAVGLAVVALVIARPAGSATIVVRGGEPLQALLEDILDGVDQLLQEDPPSWRRATRWFDRSALPGSRRGLSRPSAAGTSRWAAIGGVDRKRAAPALAASSLSSRCRSD